MSATIKTNWEARDARIDRLRTTTLNRTLDRWERQERKTQDVLEACPPDDGANA